MAITVKRGRITITIVITILIILRKDLPKITILDIHAATTTTTKKNNKIVIIVR